MENPQALSVNSMYTYMSTHCTYTACQNCVKQQNQLEFVEMKKGIRQDSIKYFSCATLFFGGNLEEDLTKPHMLLLLKVENVSARIFVMNGLDSDAVILSRELSKL